MQEYYPSKFSMIHVVGDVVLLVGVSLFLNSKINAQELEIAELKKQNEILMEKVLQIEQFLSRFGSKPVKERQEENHREEESEEIET